jgi:2-methylcitrate dehydratase PrpD
MDGLTVADSTEILTTLAGHISGFDPTRISDHGLHVAKVGIADTIGVTLAGLPEPCVQILLNTPGVADAVGPALIFGTTSRTSALDATLINGTASHALDFDDFSSIMGGHQSVPLVAPLFALGDERGLTGRDMIDAYVVGLEVEHRFARAVHPHHYDKGWHPTSTLGIFGTVAACAFAMQLGPQKTALAMAIATSMASGLKANFGTMTKPLHVGHSARNGLMACYLAEQGFEANASAMEHHQGFLNVFNGEGLFETAPLIEDWSDPLDIELPTLSLKQFACCGSMHQAIFGMLGLAKDEDIDPNRVTNIDIGLHARRLRHTNNPFPKSVLQAKFSVQYTVARALNDRAVLLKDFEGEAFFDPDIERLLDISTARPLPDDGPGPTGLWDAVVSVTLDNGTVLKREAIDMVGRSGDNAMSRDELRDKFMDCAGLVISADAASQAFDALMGLDICDDLDDIVSFLVGN